MPSFAESEVDEAALEWFAGLGYETARAADTRPGRRRATCADAVLETDLRAALRKLNPDLPADALEDAARKLLRPEGAALETRNRAAHRMIVDGVPIAYRDRRGDMRGARVRVFDFDAPANNRWRAANQFTVVEAGRERRADIVVFVNGLPLAVFELKNPAGENATLRSAFSQLQTYRKEIPALFVFNAVLAVSDGAEARVGSLTAGFELFKPWRTVSGSRLAPGAWPQLQVLIHGLFDKRRFADFLRGFIVFETGGAIVKKIAGYHQFHAVRHAVAETLRAARYGELADRTGYETGGRPGGAPGDRRVGVVWHTQGSGKSLSMAFYAARIAREPGMENPTVVVLTDRNDLDDQLFSTFARCSDLLGQRPVQAQSRADLRERLATRSGGVVFSTVQKFFPGAPGGRHPPLTERRNVVVIADEAHRGQYDFIDGFARHMRDALPNASFIGFTGTPIETDDKNTRAVFGDYIGIYDVRRAVEDGATVPIYCESRLAALTLDEAEKPRIDPDFEEATEGEEIARSESLKTRWARLEAIVGAEKRLDLLAGDIVRHFETRLEAIDGKAMIVCMSRRICVELHDRIARLRPRWRGADDAGGEMKIVMTGGASDPPGWQPHIRNKARRERLANRFRDPADPFRIAIVRDMWLTGFDAPSLHTMYLDKPMRAHALMQAIARVNRVFRDKPGGLVVDYLGLAREIGRAVAVYTESGGAGDAVIDSSRAVRAMLGKHDICCAFFKGFDRSAWTSGTPAARLALLPAAQEHVLAQRNGKERFLRAATELSRAFALVVPREEALRIRGDLSFFQDVRSVLAKQAPGEPRSGEDLDRALRGIVSRAVAPEGVIDLFSAAGLPKPDISILDDEFLAQIGGMGRRNLAVDLLGKLLRREIAARADANIVQARSFAEMLERALHRYADRAVEAAQIVKELTGIARQLRGADARAANSGLSREELAFRDALETGAADALDSNALARTARELAATVRENAKLDWTQSEPARARIKVAVRRVLRTRAYPADRLEEAVQSILEQAETNSTAAPPAEDP